MPKKRTLNDIIWPEPGLANRKDWQRNIGVVVMLFNLSSTIEWYEGKKGHDAYLRFPYHYHIKGVKVTFLPHWGFYTVGEYSLTTPMTEEDVMAAVNATKAIELNTKKLSRLGLRKQS
jgi:hypothetical protein